MSLACILSHVITTVDKLPVRDFFPAIIPYLYLLFYMSCMACILSHIITTVDKLPVRDFFPAIIP